MERLCRTFVQIRASHVFSASTCFPSCSTTPSDDNFVKLVMGKLGPQQAFLMRKLKIQGSMG